MKTKALETFKLKWRWTDPEYCLLTGDELARILPLEERSARDLWEKSLSFTSGEDNFSPNKEKFKSIESIEAIDEVKVTKWLKQRMSKGFVVVSWQPDTAVITDSDLFIKYWGEFCYPSSDDVSVWSENEKWVIHYWHEEVFWYGRV